MPLIKDGQFVEDSWTVLQQDDEVPPKGDVIVPLERYLSDTDELNRRVGRVGVALENTADPDDIAPYLNDIDLVALTFPAFTDGRAYSQARQLRHHLGFGGELRATGNVLADQAGFLKQVGFDAFEVTPNQSIDIWVKASEAVTLAYQRGYDGNRKTRDKLRPSPLPQHPSDCAAVAEQSAPA
ncbi:MAG: DUF934 domain-containing protein [Hyphomicrobiaceae bacterium]|nr:DUF934 domain-containing protein [Hyphomicrobiaceae bacterium]